MVSGMQAAADRSSCHPRAPGFAEVLAAQTELLRQLFQG